MLSLLGRHVGFWGVTVRPPFCRVYHFVVEFDYKSDECQISVVRLGDVPSGCRVCYRSWGWKVMVA